MQTIDWRFPVACAERGLRKATDLQALVRRRTGVTLNVQTLRAWLRRRDCPDRLEFRTLEAVLNALACELNDVLRFTPPASDRDAHAGAAAPRHHRQRPEPTATPARAVRRRRQATITAAMLEALPAPRPGAAGPDPARTTTTSTGLGVAEAGGAP